MPRAVLPEAKLFREVIETVGNIAEEVSLRLSQEGLSIKALDVDQSSMLDVFFPKDMFLEYDISDVYNIGISVNNIKKIFKRIKKGENLIIEPEGDYVRFNIGAGSIVSRKFRFRNLEVPVPEIPELNLNFTVTARILAQPLRKVIEDIETIGGNTELSATQDALIIRSSGVGKIETRFVRGSQALISLEVLETATSIYDTTKITNILGISKVSDIVSLEFASKMPLKAEFSVGAGRVVYLLAPFETT